MTGTVETPPQDWSFVNEHPRCVLETRPSNPYSVNVACLSYERELYVPSNWARFKRWPRHIREDPRVRYRVAGRIYELRAVRIRSDRARLELFRHWKGRRQERVPDHVWFFRLDPRDPAR